MPSRRQVTPDRGCCLKSFVDSGVLNVSLIYVDGQSYDQR